jgi:hypothetical protein
LRVQRHSKFQLRRGSASSGLTCNAL